MFGDANCLIFIISLFLLQHSGTLPLGKIDGNGGRKTYLSSFIHTGNSEKIKKKEERRECCYITFYTFTLKRTLILYI